MVSFCGVAACLLTVAGHLAQAQFPPKPEGVTVLESKFGSGARITYKEVR